MSGTSRQLPGRPGEKSPASSPQLLLLNIWMWEHSLNPINLENTKQTDIPLTWHLKTSPAGGGKARVSPAQCATATVSCLVSLFWHSSSVLLPVTEWDHIVLLSHRHFFVVPAFFSEPCLCDGGYWRPSVIRPQESDGSTSWSCTRDHTRDGSLVIPLLSLAGPHTR